jgi:DNA gyrase subunit A
MSRRPKSPTYDFANPGAVQDVSFHDAARRRYLNYAISVITARALPDVRDGLKPVQRRILYTMFHDLHLLPDRKAVKCAKVVGDVLGSYHPHGDIAVYDAMVRMAQDWNLRYTLIDGQGNFGSLDGDSPAAYRYTEAKLQPVSVELLEELGQETVDYRPNYDGSKKEPQVLPARFPQLLVNGSSGIAVGMATNVPPHNLREVVGACVALIDDRDLEVGELVKTIKGPDFPVGGEILNSRSELRAIYEEGQGSIRVRGEYRLEDAGRGAERIVVHSIPYMVNKGQLVEQIGQLIAERKVPQLVDVRDESTDEIRIVLELKRESDPELVMAYLYKNTPLQSSFGVNLTCLVPKPGSEALVPERVNLRALLVYFIDFRLEVVTRRFRHELRLLEERVHILEGFKKLFNALDEAIEMIRKSDGKKDAAEKLMARFKLDEVQVEAILELKLYKLARLEIKAILEELKEKKERIEEIEAILASPRRLWTVVKKELQEIGERFGDERRTKVSARGAEEAEFDEEAFIEDEDATILVSRDGWVRRVGRIGDLAKVRTRADDEIIAAVGGNTRSTVVFFSNFGSAYTIRIHDIPPSPRGFGDPIQRLFKFTDGERAIATYSLDPRAAPDIGSSADPEGSIPALHALAVSTSGHGFRFALHHFLEASTRAGRRYAKLREGEEIVDVVLVRGAETLIAASREGRALLCKVEEINFLGGAGRGVLVLKLDPKDRIIGFSTSTAPRTGLTVIREGGKTIPILPMSYRVSSRAGKGFEIIKRGRLDGVVRPALELPSFLGGEEGGAGGHGGPGGGGGNGNGKGHGEDKES